MKLQRIDKSNDFISGDGMFKIVADNDKLFGAYWPLMREGDGQENPVIFRKLSKEYMSFSEAEKVIENSQ